MDGDEKYVENGLWMLSNHIYTVNLEKQNLSIPTNLASSEDNNDLSKDCKKDLRNWWQWWDA